MPSKVAIKGLYYITHVDNLNSILEKGILSHEEVLKQKVPFQPIYDREIVSRRHERFVDGEKSLWSFANLYFNARNPMMYRVIHEGDKSKIAVVQVDRAVLDMKGVFVSTGNAASDPTEILPAGTGLDAIFAQWSTITSEWWKEEDGSKRKIMAEVLVPSFIPPRYIRTVYVASPAVAEAISPGLGRFPTVPVVSEPNIFFQPVKSSRITRTLSLVDGDMFFSQHQTLTISVNTVGIMGKGLASRTRYQFPDVFVEYQDLCKRRELRIGVPALYKREISLDIELADSPRTMREVNSQKWFLLFPTKRHWREPSLLPDIETGMQWLSENYEKEGIRSLAMPALGCGLGGLQWSDVGPLMCRYLSQMKLAASIYLPREVQVPSEQMTSSFLLQSLS